MGGKTGHLKVTVRQYKGSVDQETQEVTEEDAALALEFDGQAAMADGVFASSSEAVFAGADEALLESGADELLQAAFEATSYDFDCDM
eukprot:tig00022075_g23645.t1